MVDLLVKRPRWTKQEVLRSLEHPGRRTDGRQSPASWLSDLTALKKCILLCDFCRVKFNPRRHGYRKLYAPDPSSRTGGYTHNGVCDACKQRTENVGGGTAYIHEETYNLVCVDPAVARRQARERWKLAAAGTWASGAAWEGLARRAT